MLQRLEISGFKSFAKKTSLSFDTPVTAIVGPNGSGKSNVVEAIRFVLGEQSMKSLRGKGGSDLIWKGSKLLGALSKGRVAITFDNRNRVFAFSGSSGAAADISFDEVTLMREVTSDGGSNYFINGTAVRLKDITELLGSVNIGASGHHIISQGEADRLLSASAKERRAMIEDALGLKIFQTRIKESERKLEKTAQNLKEAQALRRELAPHLSFLGKQVEKIQKVEELRSEFTTLFTSYVYEESAVLAHGLHSLAHEEHALLREIDETRASMAPGVSHTFAGERSEAERALRTAEHDERELLRKKDELGRALGRIEGKLEALVHVETRSQVEHVPAETVRALCTELLDACDAAIAASDISEVQRMVRRLSDTTRGFLASLTQHEAPVQDTSIAETIRIEKEHIEAEIAGLEGTLVTMRSQADMLRNKLGQIDTKIRDAERASYAGAAKLATLEGSLRECKLRKESLEVRKATLAEEIREAEALVGLVVGNTGEKTEDTPEKLAARQTLHHKIERIKIKLEDSGVASGSEILKEYEETKERDAFLAREVIDIDTSITALKNLIADLRETIDRTFKEGIEKINVQFGEFFKLMFSGGSAFLSIVVEHKRNRGEEGEEGDNDDSLPFEHGIEINVSLPHKKVRDLAMFSGGERSLVSIALLFAMSQVNPPPFLVLDETDAALDEANSRRYGDMLALLSEHSKLVVVTHNRETMSRAQVLYGVTMGLDGASKLLSIKFDEAIKIAK